jgi:hypothetical protein
LFRFLSLTFSSKTNLISFPLKFVLKFSGWFFNVEQLCLLSRL